MSNFWINMFISIQIQIEYHCIFSIYESIIIGVEEMLFTLLLNCKLDTVVFS